MKVLAFGEIMARIAPEGALRLSQALPGKMDVLFAGAEANVCVSLARFGDSAAFLTALPGGHPVAAAALAVLAGRGVDTRHTLFRDGRFGAYWFERGAGHRPAEIVYDRSGTAISLAAPAEYAFAAALEGAAWVHLSGITPALSENAFSATLELARLAKEKGATVSFDLNFRSRLWKWKPGASAEDLARECFARIAPHVDLVIGSPESARLLGAEPPAALPRDPASAVTVGAAVAARFPNVTGVALSLREAGAPVRWGGALVSGGTAALAPLDASGAYRPYEIAEVVDPLGAGDAFAAGIIHALNSADFRSPARAIAFAAAAGCLKHSVHGDFNLVSRDEVAEFAAGRTPGHVRR